MYEGVALIGQLLLLYTTIQRNDDYRLNCLMFYLPATPWWLKMLYPGCVWNINTREKRIFLTFDDGPHPDITPFVLDQLKKWDAKATFFCIGKNVVAHPSVFRRIIEEGHSVGNHSYSHLNGWQTANNTYLNDVAKASEYIQSNLFRPPYGRISRSQLKQLTGQKFQLKTVMWSVLSGDFDKGISKEKCLQNIIPNVKNGAVIVFHDSEKAYGHMSYALPRVLDFFTSKGYTFNRLVSEQL